MQHRNAILKKVKNYTDDKLNPSKKNFLDSTKDYLCRTEISWWNFDFFRNFVARLWRSTFNFRWLWISDTLQKIAKFMFYEWLFFSWLLAWEADMDIHVWLFVQIWKWVFTNHEASTSRCIWERTEQFWANEISC